MALQATLALNTAQYQKALDDAKRALTAFGLDSSRVADQVRKVATSLDGSRIVQQANAAAAAVEGIGGATALTDKELKKVNATIQEGLEKYRKLGQDAPESLRKTADAIKSQVNATQAASAATKSHTADFKTMVGAYVTSLATWEAAKGVVAGVANAVVDAGKRTIAFADNLANLSARTGMSVEGLQQLRYGAAQSGVSMDALANATLELGRRLVDGDEGAIAALQKLGIEVQSFKQLQPDHQIIAINQALRDVKAPAEQASVAMGLFGKTGKEILAVMQQDLSALAREFRDLGAVLDTETVNAMDHFGDRIDAVTVAGEGLLARFIRPYIESLDQLAERAPTGGSVGLGTWAEALGRTSLMGANPWTVPGNLRDISTRETLTSWLSAYRSVMERGGPNLSGRPFAVRPASDYEIRALDEQTKAQTAAIEANRKLAEKAAEMAEFAKLAASRWHNIVLTSDWLAARMGQVARGMAMPALDLTPPLGGQANPWGGIGMLAPRAMNPSLSALMRPGFDWSKVSISGVNAAMPFLSQLVAGGSRGSQIGGSIGGTVGGIVGSPSLFGGLAGLGGFAGVLGAAAPFMGPVLGLAGALIGKLFGPSRGAILGQQADARLAQTQQGLLAQFGSVDAIRALGGFGGALADAWGSRNVGGEAWFNRLNEGLQQQLDLQQQIKDVEAQRKALVESLVPTWDQLTQAAARYGFDVNELGESVQQIGTIATFKQIAEDLDLFGRATQDVGGYLSRMSGVISEAVQQALRFGTEVPENMRPFIEELAKSGQLLDENGQAITDLSALRWGPVVQAQAELVRDAIEKLNETFDRLSEKLEALFHQLTTGLVDAAWRGAQGASDAISSIEGPSFRFSGVEAAPSFARGGLVYAARGLFVPRGTDTVPAMLSPGEFVMSSAAVRRIGASTLARMNRGEGGGSPRPIVVQVTLDGRVVAESTARHLPDLLPLWGV